MSTENQQLLRCPITHQLFGDPVIASDGHTYEREAIEDWLRNHSCSPITKGSISKNIVTNYVVKSLLDYTLKTNPELKEIQYKIKITAPKDKILSNPYGYDLYDWCDIMSFERNIIINIFEDEQLALHLISHEINLVKSRARNEEYPLHFACINSSLKVITQLLDKKVNLCMRELNTGAIPLHFACERGDTEIIKHMINADISQLDIRNRYNDYPIHLICKYCDDEMIKTIIDIDIEHLNYHDSQNMSPIHHLCASKSNELIKYLLERNVDIDTKDDRGRTPLHWLCCRKNTLDALKYMITEMECDLTERTKDGQLPIHLVCEYGSVEMIKFMLDLDDVNFEESDSSKLKPIHYLCQRNDTFEVLKYLIEQGGVLECVSNKGWKPIHYACKFGSPEMIQYLIDKNVELDDMTEDEQLPFILLVNRNLHTLAKQIYSKNINKTRIKIKYGKREDVMKIITQISSKSNKEIKRYFLKKEKKGK